MEGDNPRCYRSCLRQADMIGCAYRRERPCTSAPASHNSVASRSLSDRSSVQRIRASLFAAFPDVAADTVSTAMLTAAGETLHHVLSAGGDPRTVLDLAQDVVASIVALARVQQASRREAERVHEKALRNRNPIYSQELAPEVDYPELSDSEGDEQDDDDRAEWEALERRRARKRQ